MNTISFDELIQSYKMEHVHTYTMAGAIGMTLGKKYDVLSFYGHMVLNPGDTPCIVRDYITDIKSVEPLYYVVDDKEYQVNSSTKMLSFLTPLKQVMFRNKTDRVINISFKRFIIKHELVNKFIRDIVEDNGHCYYYGEIHTDIPVTVNVLEHSDKITSE